MEESRKRVDEKYCFECGAVIRAKAEICPKCGCRQPAFGGAAMADLDRALSPAEPKSRTTAAALAILLGGLGAHKFYLGKPLIGIFYIVFILTFIPAILGLIEGLRYLSMSDAEFQQRYATGTLDHLGKMATTDSVTPETHVKCPDCRELVPRDARICSHCGCKLIPQ